MVTTRAFLIGFSVPWLGAETKRHSPQNEHELRLGNDGCIEATSRSAVAIGDAMEADGRVDKFGYRQPKKKRPQSGGN
jgi:hypothetical protein